MTDAKKIFKLGVDLVIPETLGAISGYGTYKGVSKIADKIGNDKVRLIVKTVGVIGSIGVDTIVHGLTVYAWCEKMHPELKKQAEEAAATMYEEL